MKKFIMISLMLMIGLSTFAQKVNPQGKKLVKSITIARPIKSSNDILTFKYDDIGYLNELYLQKSNASFLKNSNNLLYVYKNDIYNDCKYIIQLDNQGHLSSIKEFFNTQDGSKQWRLWEYQYDYDYEIGGDAIVELSTSSWLQFNGKSPEPFGYGEIMHEIFSYFNGGLQNCSYITSHNEDHTWSDVDKIYTYTDLTNDTSINLMLLIINSACSMGNLKPLLLTEWCPTTAIKLPKEYVWEKRRTGTKQTIYTYEYVYENDNLTTILIHKMRRDEITSTTIITIEYYY